MRISNNSYGTQNLFRYCLSCTRSSSPKTLNPKTLETLLPSNSLFTISSLCNSSSGSSSFCSFESYPLQEKPFISRCSSGSSSVLCCGLYSLQKKQALGCSSSGSIENPFLIDSSSWLSLRCKIESHSRYRNQSLCYFLACRPSKVLSLKQSFLQSLDSLTLVKHNFQYVCSSFGTFHCGKMYRCFSVSSSNEMFISGPIVESEVQSVKDICSDQQMLEMRNKFPQKYVLEIVDIVRNNGKDLESRLIMLGSKLSIYSVTEIFEVLNSQRICGLRLFEWIWSNNPQLRKNAHICSLIIDNVGRLSDYETMFAWLKKFTAEKICLTYEAFGFLPVLASTDSSLYESAKRVVDALDKVGGSCRRSGVHALIEMFCKLDLFEMAKYVIKITEHKESYYCLLLREKCGRGHIEDAYRIILEMREAHCSPSTRAYNYILGSLWKNGRMDEASELFDEMNENGSAPDAITFEILISFVCRFGKMDDVHQRLDQMVSRGLGPRLTTHACIIKTLFAAEKYEAAHEYVVDSSIVYKTSSSMMYSLLANLYLEKSDIMSARNILVEMMEKSLKPNFSIYIKILKQLRRAGRGNLARDLKNRHSKFVIKSQARHL
ncbi:hypothetical protein CDL12_04944 [Handroanthus impetiginosus]|uniref:Pentacotripeptide-repeat region of PRORP domain-containing protein n=1 Tax=Handroanthus impetiginosus TaxID=429701 RepID=A0A2G9HXV9_9LAMI|nr:hypothetical protein CDL12_04944 [Handroanthus impetiginosus]